MTKKDLKNDNLVIFQIENGAIEFRGDFDNEDVIWGSLNQIADLFNRDKSVISRHIKNIFKTGELDSNSTVAKIATVQNEGGREVVRDIEYFNLDVILSVGYRVDSQQATQFRIWATKTLKQHITKGYTINKKVLKKNYEEFLKAIDDIKLLAKNNDKISQNEILELIKTFSYTWFSLESYDKQDFPEKGKVRVEKEIDLENFSHNLYQEIDIFKKELMDKQEATELFAQEKNENSLEGILGNVFQSVFGKEVYGTVEEKAAHLLYFVIKNHPFTDGNKRTGAFSFIWFLQKMKFDFKDRISPETLTTLTLLIAESDPKDMKKMIGLVLIILKK